MKDKPIIYVAGKYSDELSINKHRNIERAYDSACFIWKNGGVAICPHKNTEFMGGLPNTSYDTWLDGGIQLLKKCDAVYMIHGWRDSHGAKIERDVALVHHIPVFYDGDSLLAFIKEYNDG